MEKRLYLAFVCAPVVGTMVAGLGFAVTAQVALAPTSAPSLAGDQFPHVLGVYLTLGLPLAYLGELVALSLVRAHASTSRRLRQIAPLATTLGGAISFGVWALLFDARFGLFTVPSGLAGGGAAGITWWLLGARSTRSARVV